jgi:DNA-binding beta-propeller fold protein YncE
MKTLKILPVLLFVYSCHGQKQFGTDQLSNEKTISLPGVKGRIDHMDANVDQQTVFVSALGNNSLEIVNIKQGKLIQSIKGFSEPQGVGFIPQTNEIIVANGGNGKCIFYSGSSFQLKDSIDLGSDADDVRYDSIEQRIYVGYGEGGIAIIDVVKHQKIADIKLDAHPEGFQLDKELRKIYVNVPDANQIDVIDLNSQKVTEKWKTEYGANFPMAIDIKDHVIFVGFRHPAKLVATDAKTGKLISATDLTGDADDLYYDSQSGKIYASGGSGTISIYQFEKSGIKQIGSITTRNGARTSLLIPQLHNFILAERASDGNTAAIQVYKTKE